MPLGEDLLGGLGEHLPGVHEHLGRASTRAPLLGSLAQLTLGTVEDGHGAARDGDAAGDGGDGAPELPGRVGGGRAPRLARPTTERWRRQASE
jgi:hypothetical protein